MVLGNNKYVMDGKHNDMRERKGEYCVRLYTERSEARWEEMWVRGQAILINNRYRGTEFNETENVLHALC